MTPEVQVDVEDLVAQVERTANGDPHACLAIVPDVLRAADAAGDDFTRMRVLYYAGFAHSLVAHDAEALAAVEEALRLARQRGDHLWEARVIGGLGAVHSGFGDNESAIEHLEQSIGLRRELGDTLGVAIGLQNMGVTFEEMGLFPDRARELLHEARHLFDQLGHSRGLSATLVHLAILDIVDAEAAAATDTDLARAIAAGAASIAAEARAHARLEEGNARILADTLVQGARALLVAGDLAGAAELLAEAVPLHEQLRTPRLTVSVTVTRAKMHRMQGEGEQAVEVLHEGLRAAEALVRGGERVQLLAELVDVHEEQGDLALALATHRELLRATLQHRGESAERRARLLNERLDLERARMEAEMERLRSEQLELANRVLSHEAKHDGLTGLANRRAFDDALAERTAQPGTAVTCVIGDLDHFKSVNDRFSHLVGDDVLRKVAEILGAAVRGTDVVARLGGEEFSILLDEGDDPETAGRVCERIRASIATHDWDQVAPGLAVTISLGAAHRRPGETGEELVARADALMYRAKATGRDRVVLDTD